MIGHPNHLLGPSTTLPIFTFFGRSPCHFWWNPPIVLWQFGDHWNPTIFWHFSGSSSFDHSHDATCYSIIRQLSTKFLNFFGRSRCHYKWDPPIFWWWHGDHQNLAHFLVKTFVTPLIGQVSPSACFTTFQKAHVLNKKRNVSALAFKH